MSRQTGNEIYESVICKMVLYSPGGPVEELSGIQQEAKQKEAVKKK